LNVLFIGKETVALCIDAHLSGLTVLITGNQTVALCIDAHLLGDVIDTYLAAST